MPTNAPAVSVLMPVYNGAASVGAAVESVLAQTLDGFELIIVNDGSTDDTAAVLRNYVCDDRVRLVELESNQGLVASLNHGLEACQAALVARLDADDTCEPTRLARQVEAFSTNRSLVLSATAYRRVRPDGSLIRVGHPPQTHAQLVGSLLSGNRLCHSSVMFRRQPAMDLGGYRSTWFPVEDFDLWLRLSAVGEFRSVPSVEVTYLDNPGGISSLNSTRQDTLHRARANEELGRLSGRSVSERSSDAQRIRALEKARRVLVVDLAERGIDPGGLTSSIHRSMMLLLAERSRVARHTLIAANAPFTLCRAAWEHQFGRRDT